MGPGRRVQRPRRSRIRPASFPLAPAPFLSPHRTLPAPALSQGELAAGKPLLRRDAESDGRGRAGPLLDSYRPLAGRRTSERGKAAYADVLVSLPLAVAARPVENAQNWAGRLNRDGHARSMWQPNPNREGSPWTGSLDQEEPCVPRGAKANDSRLCPDAASPRKRSVTGQGAYGCGRLQRSLLVTRGEIDDTAHQLDVPSNLSCKPLAQARNRHRLAALIADLDRRPESSNPAGSPAHVAEHNDRRSAKRLQGDAQLRGSTERERLIR
jgi:hypothetical protein